MLKKSTCIYLVMAFRLGILKNSKNQNLDKSILKEKMMVSIFQHIVKLNFGDFIIHYGTPLKKLIYGHLVCKANTDYSQ